MRRVKISLPDVCEVRPKAVDDVHGFFPETRHRRRFADLGITDSFVQDKHSRSAKGILRGLHHQLRHPQSKLCHVAEGEALDVVIDICRGSLMFRRITSRYQQKCTYYLTDVPQKSIVPVPDSSQ